MVPRRTAPASSSSGSTLDRACTKDAWPSPQDPISARMRSEYTEGFVTYSPCGTIVGWLLYMRRKAASLGGSLPRGQCLRTSLYRLSVRSSSTCLALVMAFVWSAAAPLGVHMCRKGWRMCAWPDVPVRRFRRGRRREVEEPKRVYPRLAVISVAAVAAQSVLPMAVALSQDGRSAASAALLAGGRGCYHLCGWTQASARVGRLDPPVAATIVDLCGGLRAN